MKKVIALAALTALAGSAFAQLSPVPPSSNLDGVFVNDASANQLGAGYWGNPSGIAAYEFYSDANLASPRPGTPDNKLGLNWGGSYNAHVQSMLNSIQADGGSIRVIFLGESAGWMNDFGYTYSGDPAVDSYSLWNNISGPGNVQFGDYATIGFGAGELDSFDLWLNAANSYNTTNRAPGAPGGYYTAFNPAAGNPPTWNVRWTQSALNVLNYDEGLGDQWASTYLVGFEDWRLGSADKDFNDFMIGVQFFKADGTPFTPVPEPSTYGLIGAAALLGLVARRRFSKK